MLPIIWMSPGNSYFKDKEVAYLIKESIKKYDRAVVLVADIPAISTYLAMWYNIWKAREKAVLKWNNIKNRTKKIVKELWIDDNKLIIVDRDREVKDTLDYIKQYNTIKELYNINLKFHTAVNDTSELVLKNSWKVYSLEDIEKATHYLLSEIAFLEYSPQFFWVDKVAYVYHKNRFVFEDYISWIFDWCFRSYLDFILIESPYETYLPTSNQYQTRLDIIKSKWIIKAMFVPYFEYFKMKGENYSWLFFEILNKMALNSWLKIEFVEQTGYGVISERLNSGFADVFCSPIWPTKRRRLENFFSKSIFQSNIFAYFNSASPYVNQSLEKLQENPKLRIAVKENDIHHDLAQEFFPKARLVRVPQLSDISEVIKFVIENRADMTFWEDKLTQRYLEENKFSIGILTKKSFEKDTPITIYDNCFALPWWEFELKEILDATIQKM